VWVLSHRPTFPVAFRHLLVLVNDLLLSVTVIIHVMWQFVKRNCPRS